MEYGNFPLRAYWLSSFLWTLIAVCVALLISGFTRPYLGFLAAMAMTTMPYSNLVMLAQVNTIYMPAVLAMIIAVVVRHYPKSKGFQIVICAAFALVTLTSITTIVAFGYLIWLVFFSSLGRAVNRKTLDMDHGTRPDTPIDLLPTAGTNNFTIKFSS